MAGIRLFAVAVITAGVGCLTATAFAADLPAKAPAYNAPAAAAPNWTGFYVGLNAGYGWGSGSTGLIGLDPLLFIPGQRFGAVPTSLSPRMNGFIGGGQIGFNWQLNQSVIGLETDIAYSAMNGDSTYSTNVLPNPPLTTAQTNKVTWLGTLRPRLGWLWTPTVMVYASGGLAYGGVKASTNVNVDVAGSCPAVNAFCAIGSRSTTRVGWTLGGGVESIIAGNWSARIDYLYFDLGHESYPVVSTVAFGPGGTAVMRADAKFNGHIVRAGLNYRF